LRTLYRPQLLCSRSDKLACAFFWSARTTLLGALLITDWKKNLQEMFEAGTEILAYRSADECRDLVEYYLSLDAERQAIAEAGQRRTLREHTYYQRMQELVDIIGKCM